MREMKKRTQVRACLYRWNEMMWSLISRTVPSTFRANPALVYPTILIVAEAAIFAGIAHFRKTCAIASPLGADHRWGTTLIGDFRRHEDPLDVLEKLYQKFKENQMKTGSAGAWLFVIFGKTIVQVRRGIHDHQKF